MTIGRPLPTYSIVILDAERRRRWSSSARPGEIGIAGIGVAEGYLNRPRADARRSSSPTSSACPNNPSGRIYRTGDLGRINDDGEIEYLGRIDTQVKLRGYRIELTEIESVLLEIPEIAQAVVATFEPDAGRAGARRLLLGQARRGRAGARPRSSRIMRAAPARLHDARLSRAAAVHPDAGQQQGRPRASCRSRSRRGCGSATAIAPPSTRDRGDAVRGASGRRSASTRSRSTATSSTNTARIRC